MELLGALARTLVNVVVAVTTLVGTAINPAPAATPQRAPEIAAQMRATVGPPSAVVSSRLLVRYKTHVTSALADEVERAHGARKKMEISQLRVRVLEVPAGTEAAALQELAADPLVE